MRERLGDLDDLLLADAQVADHLVGVDVLFQAGQQLACLAAAPRCRSMATPRTSSWARKRLSSTDRLAQRLSSWKMMPMPCCAAAVTLGQLDRLAVHEHAPRGGLLHAGEDLHQRRLAGAVLADEDVDLAGVDVEGDVVEGGRAREDLGDVLGAHGHALGRSPASRP